MGTMKFS